VSSPQRSLAVTMPVTEVSQGRDDFEWGCCLNCGSPLGLVQPEVEDPWRFVGTCAACGCWYLLDWHHDSREGLMILLPNHGELLRVFLS
jgi:hypothetical protein